MLPCHNQSRWEYRRYITWFTLFFIPVILYNFLYIKACPVCGQYEELSKSEFTTIVDRGTDEASTSTNPNVAHNDGLTETQRNYRKQMEQLMKERS